MTIISSIISFSFNSEQVFPYKSSFFFTILTLRKASSNLNYKYSHSFIFLQLINLWNLFLLSIKANRGVKKVLFLFSSGCWRLLQKIDPYFKLCKFKSFKELVLYYKGKPYNIKQSTWSWLHRSFPWSSILEYIL